MREPSPITRVELTEKNKKLRIIAAVLLLVIGIFGITVGIMNVLNKDTGWQEVTVFSEERNCSESFLLQYHFTGSGAQATTVNKQLEAVYTEATVKAYQLFTPDEEIPGVQNIYYVNHHPNEVITVDPVLYDAFRKLEGTPWLYLGPAYSHYYSLLFNTGDDLLPELDPAVSREAREYVDAIAKFAADADAVRLELLGDNQVRLCVSQEYLDFAQTEEIENFLDFAHMTNAFIIDYLADALISAGLTEGYLVSTDGFTRNLDSKNQFQFNIFDREENLVYPAGVMEYTGPISIVYLKDYPTAGSDINYRVSGDHFVHLLLDPADGICRTAAENLVSYSYDTGCAEVLLRMLPGFVGNDFTLPEGVFSIWCEEETIFYNDDSISIHSLLQSEDRSYRAIKK